MISNKPLPIGWCEAPLPHVAQVNPALPIEAPNDDTVVSFVPMASVETLSGRLDPSNRRPWHEVKKGYTRFQDGDVLFAKITPCMENGKAALARGLSSGIGAGSTEFHILRPSPAVRPELLLHYVLQEEFRKSARAQMTGTAGQLRVPARFLDEQTIPVPPLPEQHRIVEAIESYFTRLDDAVATLERVQRNLKRYRASVLKAAVEGRLVPTEVDLARAEGRSYEPASVLLTRILTERRRRWEEAELAKMSAKGKPPKDDKWKAKYVEPVAPDTSDLPELPEGWCWATVSQLLCRLQTGPFGSSLHKADYVAGGTPIINPQHLVEYGIRPSDRVAVSTDTVARLSTFLLRAGDIVLSRRGEMGRCALVGARENGWLLGTGSLALRPVEDVDGGFLVWVLRSPRSVGTLEGESVGTTMTNLNQEILHSLQVPLVPAAEQVRITREIERHFSFIDVLDFAASTQRIRIAQLRQSILKWAFEGRLVDQDPTDEPASVLLERIRAEREAKPFQKARGPRRT